MQNGTTIIRKTHDGIQSIHFDQEVMEFAAQNAKVRARQENAASKKRRSARMAARKKRMEEMMSSRTISLVIGMGILAGLWYSGLVNTVLTLLLEGIGLVLFGVMLGRWMEWR